MISGTSSIRPAIKLTNRPGTGIANNDPVKPMAGLETVIWGMAAVLAEGGIKLVFWAIDERRRKLTEQEIDTLQEARERLKQVGATDSIAIVDDMIEDLRRNPLRIRRGRRR